MKDLRTEALAHDVFVKSDGTFQRRARLLQALWREEMGYAPGEYTPARGANEGKPTRLGSRLKMPEAQTKRWNFLTPAIGNLVVSEVEANQAVPDTDKKLYALPRLYDDLLSSQPLCFNLFGELATGLDKKVATGVVTALWDADVDQVTAIRFEHSPGRRNPEYLNNRSAADAFIEYATKSGEQGFISVETKYHENLRGGKAEPKDRYGEVALASNCFVDPLDGDFAKPPLQQIWLDHLLALSILQHPNGQFQRGTFVLCAPALNTVCHTEAGRYSAKLSDGATFRATTIEDVLDAIVAAGGGSWTSDFQHRYLDFDRTPER